MDVWFFRHIDEWQQRKDGILQHEAGCLERLAAPLKGGCPVCRQSVQFAGDLDGDLRESLLCATCGSNTRQRAVALLMSQTMPVPEGQARVHMAEQATVFFQWHRGRFARLYGGEFGFSLLRRLVLQAWFLRRYRSLQWLRKRDMTALDFNSGSLHMQVSQDVLEHVPSFAMALRESARVLMPGGAMVFTVPFYWESADNTAVSWFDADGALHHAGQPEYHGDPVAGGVLCFHHFGWALLDAMRAAGFADAQVARVLDPASGVPQGQWVFYGIR